MTKPMTANYQADTVSMNPHRDTCKNPVNDHSNSFFIVRYYCAGHRCWKFNL